MGQQQLLLLVVALAMVGIAIVVGFSMFHNAADAAQIDAVNQQCTFLAARAQAYYMIPAFRGGGGNTFTGLTVAKLLPPSHYFPAGENEDGIFQITVEPQILTVTGTPRRSSAAGCVVVATVTSSFIKFSTGE